MSAPSERDRCAEACVMSAPSVTCPACKALAGQACRTIINGVDVGWTHDARVYAELGVQHR